MPGVEQITRTEKWIFGIGESLLAADSVGAE